MEYTDRVVVITGAGSGMGRAYALEFAQRGAILALNDVNAHALAETVSLLDPPIRVLTGAYDVADRTATEAFAEQVRTTLGDACVVVNNAGIEGAGTPIWATDPPTYDRVMAVNYSGVLHGTRAFLPQLLAGDRGAIVNVSSVFGLIGVPNHADYCASKFAVRGFTEALAAELLHTPISVHLVHPGGVATNIARREETQAFAGKYLTTPPEQIARVVVDAIGTRRTRIVVGRGSRRIWLAARLLPLPVLARLLWREMSPVLHDAHYPASRTGGVNR
jgi:NAD(P)-dependent dehydrogenase (short-subunit alcohol dehydrogenase family)